MKAVVMVFVGLLAVTSLSWLLLVLLADMTSPPPPVTADPNAVTRKQGIALLVYYLLSSLSHYIIYAYLYPTSTLTPSLGPPNHGPHL